MIGTPCRTTLFCDFDGPIVDVSERYYATYRQSLANMIDTLGGEHDGPCNVLTKEQFWSLKQQRIPDFEIALRSGIPECRIDDFLAMVRQLVNQPSLLHLDVLQPGVRWALELMNSQGVRLVLVTLRQQSQVVDILKNHQLDHLFKAVWGTHETSFAYANSSDCKTALLKQAWDLDCATYGQPQNAWMVGDTEADLIAGKHHRIGTVALTCGIRSRLYLSQYRPDYICEDLVSVTHSLVSSAQAISFSRQDTAFPSL